MAVIIRHSATLHRSPFHQGAQPTAPLLRLRRTPGCRSEANQVLEALQAWIVLGGQIVIGQTGAQDQHAGRVHDGVELLLVILQDGM
jgi:hypothetical protein